MANKPAMPSRPDGISDIARISAEWIAKLWAVVDYLRTNSAMPDGRTLQVRDGLLVARASGGAAAASGGQDGTVLCQIIDGDAEHGYSVRLYDNGSENPHTGTGKLFIVALALGADMPGGTWILGHKKNISVTQVEFIND